MATRIASEDLTWLLMDEPHNLMNVNGLIGFDELPDVDAVTVSMTRLTPQPLSLPDAALAILAAVASNNVAKTVIGVVAGRGAFALEIAVLTLLCLVGGGLAYWLALSVSGA